MEDRLGRGLRLAQASHATWPRSGPKRAKPRCSTRPKSNRRSSSRPAPDYYRMTYGLRFEQSLPGNLSMEDWQVMREVIAAVRQAIPDAASAPPAAAYT
jgi:hypothetical protein